MQVCILNISTHTHKQGSTDICALYHNIFQGQHCCLCYCACNAAAYQAPKKGPWKEAEIVTVSVAGVISEAHLLFTAFLFPTELQSPPIKQEEAFLWVRDSAVQARSTDLQLGRDPQECSRPDVQQLPPMKRKTIFETSSYKAPLGIYLCRKLK